MWIYLITFFASYLLLKISRTKKNKVVKFVAVFLALLLPSILAGMRDYSIGTDIEVYGNIWFDRAVAYTKTRDLFAYLKWANSSSIGVVYALVNYIVACFTSNSHWFYFILNLLTNGLIYKAAKDNEDIVDVPFAMLVYYLLFYNQSLNILRQSLALAFTLCSFKDIRENNVFKLLIWSILAILSHNSAIVIIALFLIYKGVNSNFKIYMKLTIFIGNVIVVVGFSQIGSFLLKIGVLSSRYESFLSTFQRGGAYTRLFLLCLPNLLMLFLLIKRNNAVKEAEAFKYYTVSATILSFLAFRMTYITRVALYFDIFYILSIPLVWKNMKINVVNQRKSLNKIIIILYLIFYWMFVYVYKQSGATVPYISFV